MNNVTMMLLGYIGPETMLPFASILAAGLGVILMFWKFIWRLICRMFRAIFRLKKKNEGDKTVVPTNLQADGSVVVKSASQEDAGDAKE